jgi:hypothetical protein
MCQSTAQKSVLWWAQKHRHHHLYSDTECDVHSPRHKGFVYSHLGWIFARRHDGTDLVKIADFARFPELMWLHRYELVPAFVLAIACFLIAGWPGLFIGFFLSTVLIYHGALCINSLANVCRLLRTDREAGRAMLADLMRYLESALPRMRDDSSTLARETELVRAFLAVHQVRMGQRLEVHIDVQPQLGARVVPPMMLLTLIENALKHGLGPLPEGGAISVGAVEVGGRLVLRVADTGRGLAAGSGGGTGLANIHARLKAMAARRGFRCGPADARRRGGNAPRHASRRRWRMRFRRAAPAPRRVGGTGVAPNGLAAHPSGVGGSHCLRFVWRIGRNLLDAGRRSLAWFRRKPPQRTLGDWQRCDRLWRDGRRRGVR